MQYHAFDISVSATDTPFEYLLSAQSSTQGEASGRTTIAASAAPLAALLTQLNHKSITTADLQALGLALYQSLFTSEISTLFNRALGETLGKEDLGLRLRLRINPPELAALPWELLYSPERRLFLAASVETPLSRYLNLPEPIRGLACPNEIRMLVVIPQNSDLDTTAEAETFKKIREKLRGKLVLHFVEGLATGAAIRAALREKDYHIFHYAGHGSFKGEQAFLSLDHEEKMVEAMPAPQFAQFFADYPGMRLVALNACKGATRSAHHALVGTAPQLVFAGAPAVIAMQDSIDNDDAILFATEFYAELCHERNGGQVEVAISRARKALLQEKPASAVFGNPVLYLRAEDGRLWQAQAKFAETEPKVSAKAEKKKSLLEHWQVWVGAIGGILAIFAALTELPEKAVKMYNFLRLNKSDSTQTVEFQTLAGQIIDASNNNPLEGVIVILPKHGLTDTTDASGRYEFQVKAPYQVQVRLQARKVGYLILNEDPTLSGNFDIFKMQRIQ